MKKLEMLDYLRLNKWEKFLYNLQSFFCGIPGWFAKKFKSLGRKIVDLALAFKENILDIGRTFKKGRWQTRVSFFVMGFGNISYGQPLRGILFFLFEVAFIAFMAIPNSGGAYWLSKFGSLGTLEPQKVYDPILDVFTMQYFDNSFKILLYGLLTIIFMVAFVYTWRLNVKQCQICDEHNINAKPIRKTKDDIRALVDEEFHKTLLTLPVLGIAIFTVIPIIFMILVAFTSYGGAKDGYANLFHWVGLDNFNTLLGINTSTGSMSVAFGEILLWTLIWAFFATFTNYFLGMFVAMMINKKGIRFKKWWRLVLVISIAVPQFISLLYVSNMFGYNGVINEWLMKLGIERIHFWDDPNNPHIARALIIIINIWIGIPYLMLITTGILMNIPQDLYESSKIDGANAWQQYTKITLPYMLFVTGPYLLTSFTSNLNNFNVIYLLNKGEPVIPVMGASGTAGYTDILITWLFKITMGTEADYKIAAVLGIIIFLVVSIISLVVYNLLPSNKNEEDFS